MVEEKVHWGYELVESEVGRKRTTEEDGIRNHHYALDDGHGPNHGDRLGEAVCPNHLLVQEDGFAAHAVDIYEENAEGELH